MTISGNQLIGFAQSGKGNEKFSGAVKDEQGIPYSFHEATIAEIDDAIHKAHNAAAVYKRIPYAKRAEFLQKIADEIMAIFQKLNDDGHTVVMITHEPDIAAHAKRVLHVKDGKIVNDVLNKKQVRAKIVSQEEDK